MSEISVRHGKVRDVYDLGDSLLLVASDRISAFDWILGTDIPDKGRILTQLSNFWFQRLDVPNHLIESDPDFSILPELPVETEFLKGRSIRVKKCEVVPFECVVRGYLVGGGWKEYQESGSVSGVSLPSGMKCAQKIEEPIFTPATKAETGHDENVSFQVMANKIGKESADWLKETSVRIYQQGRDFAAEKGIIIADTKFEFGWYQDQLILIDEVMTPDSSRFWPADSYQVGSNPSSYDKQFVRDYLETTSWDKDSQPPALPDSIVTQTRDKYLEAYRKLTGEVFPWA